MNGIINFPRSPRVSRRSKTPKACQRCQEAKKRCQSDFPSSGCVRCTQEGRVCSLQVDFPISPVSLESKPGGARHVVKEHHRDFISTPDPPNNNAITGLGTVDRAASDTIPLQHPSYDSPIFASQDQYSAPIESDQYDSHESTQRQNPTELRLASMLEILSKKPERKPRAAPQLESQKLILGTNPLPALLRKDLKQKIITNGCSFRTPDPSFKVRGQHRRQGAGIGGWDWEGYYRTAGVDPTKLQYLRSIGCFDLPASELCGRMLETYFSYVHPMLPVLDRQTFLGCYYGIGDPPPLVILHAVFLAAARYLDQSNFSIYHGGRREYCDILHSRLKALLDTDIGFERIAIVQASLLASLHWEGREGANSAIHSLGLAVRVAQEMGLHRKVNESQSADDTAQTRGFQQRLWWAVYILDRLNAAQEGSPFIINEIDCDTPALTEADLVNEDTLTQKVTLFSFRLARVIESVVRKLYGPSEDEASLLSPEGYEQRQQTSLELEALTGDVVDALSPGQVPTGQTGVDFESMWCSLLLCHINAVKILVHRPFLLSPMPMLFDNHMHTSRDICRLQANNISSILLQLYERHQLRFSWPFTVYALVNCLLITWYDISSSVWAKPQVQRRSRRDYASVVMLLKEMGETWWAAAAKYQLAKALARIVDNVQVSVGTQPQQPEQQQHLQRLPQQSEGMALVTAENHGQLTRGAGTLESTGLIQGTQSYDSLSQDGTVPFHFDEAELFTGSDDFDYWTAMGLDFDEDVARNVFGIFLDHSVQP